MVKYQFSSPAPVNTFSGLVMVKNHGFLVGIWTLSVIVSQI